MKDLSRRALLRASPVALVPGLLAVPALAASAVTTPVMRLFQQWEAAHAFFNGPEGKAITDEDEFSDRWEAAIRPIELAVETEPATDLRDMAAKVLILSGEGCWALPGAIVQECSALAGRDPALMPGFLAGDRRAAGS